MNIKVVKCYIKACLDFFKYGVFVPHLYEEVDKKPAIIIATDNSFRVSKGYEHEPNETVYPNALLVRYKCIRCGKETYAWYRNQDDYVE